MNKRPLTEPGEEVGWDNDPLKDTPALRVDRDKGYPTPGSVSVRDLEATPLVERLREEWDALGLISYHGTVSGVWYADLTQSDIEQIRDLIREAGEALSEGSS